MRLILLLDQSSWRIGDEDFADECLTVGELAELSIEVTTPHDLINDLLPKVREDHAREIAGAVTRALDTKHEKQRIVEQVLEDTRKRLQDLADLVLQYAESPRPAYYRAMTEEIRDLARRGFIKSPEPQEANEPAGQ